MAESMYAIDPDGRLVPVPEHTDQCQEDWDDGCRCFCSAWWWENSDRLLWPHVYLRLAF